MPNLSEVENDLCRLWNPQKAHLFVQGLRAREQEIEDLKEDMRQLKGILNCMNQCGDVTRVLERTF